MTPTPFNFDTVNSRYGTDATQIEELEEKFGRTDLLPLWIADMDFAISPAITEALAHRAQQKVLGYTYAPDSFWNSITDWLRRRHGWNLSREEVDYVPGVKKGLGLAVLHFTAPGDKVVIQPPVYHSFRSILTGYGRVPVENPLLHKGDHYEMDIEGLERICSEQHPRMMIVCNPHNPIGAQWSRETLAKVAEICSRNNVLLLSDEIYGDMILTGGKHYPTALSSDTARDITVTIGAPSKSFNIPGIACAWTAILNPELRKSFFDFLLTSEFDTPPVFAVSAVEAAYNKSEQWLDEVLVYLNDNAGFAMKELAKIDGVTAIRPDAGFGLWVDFRGLGLSHEQLISLIINKARVAMNDGASFGACGEGFTRMNIGVPRTVLAEGIRRIADAISSLK